MLKEKLGTRGNLIMKQFVLGKLLVLILWNLIGIACPEIVAFWPMNEGKGETVRDESDNKADLKLVGLTKWADGIRGSGLEFNGQPKNYVVSKNVNINFPGSFTIKGWFKPHQINGFIIGTAADIDPLTGARLDLQTGDFVDQQKSKHASIGMLAGTDRTRFGFGLQRRVINQP